MSIKEFEQRIIDVMIHENLIPKTSIFEVTELLLQTYVDLYGEIFGNKKGRGIKRKSEYSFARKLAGRTLVKLNQLRGASISDIRAGMVYLIESPAYKDHLKVGMTLDVIERLNSYQTYSPFRDFRVVKYDFVLDRRRIETLILYHPDIMNELGEWILRDKAEEIFSKIVHT